MIGTALALALMQTAADTPPPPAPVLAGVDCPRYAPRRQPLSVTGVCQPASPVTGQTTLIPATSWNASLAATRWSGLSADAAGFKLADGPVASGGEVVRIQVRQAFGGRLTRELNGKTWGGGGRRFLPAGTPVYGLAEFSQPGIAGAIFIWCAPIAAGKTAATPDRALCFIDRRQRNKMPGPIPFMPMNIDNMNTVVMSKPGQSPYAPEAIDFAYSPPVKPAEAEPTGQPYPFAMTLVVRWTAEGASGARFTATLDDGAGPKPLIDWRDADATGDSGAFMLAGGLIGYTRSGETLTLQAVSPVQDGGLVRFTPDRSDGSSH